MTVKDIENASDVLNDSICKCIALIDAMRELGKMESTAEYDLIMNPTDLKKPENWDKFKTIADIIGNHNTVSELSRILQQELTKIEQASCTIEDSFYCKQITISENQAL